MRGRQMQVGKVKIGDFQQMTGTPDADKVGKSRRV